MRRTTIVVLVAWLVTTAGCLRSPEPQVELEEGETITTTSTDNTTTTIRRGPAPGWEPARKPAPATTVTPPPAAR